VKKLIFLGVGIILLVVVAAVGMSFVGGGGSEEEQVAAKPEEPKEPPAPLTIELRPMSVPLVQDGDVSRYVIMMAKYDLMVRPDQAAAVEENHPVLRDALVRAVHAKPIKASKDGKSFDATDLEARFIEAANKVFPKGATQKVEVGEAQASKPAPAAPPPAPKKESGGGHGGGH
jgi:hypothetical protein